MKRAKTNNFSDPLADITREAEQELSTGRSREAAIDRLLDFDDIALRVESGIGNSLATTVFSILSVSFADRLVHLSIFAVVTILWLVLHSLPLAWIEWIWTDRLYRYYGTYGTKNAADAHKRLTTFVTTVLVSITFLYFAQLVAFAWDDASFTVEEALVGALVMLLFILGIYRFVVSYHYARTKINHAMVEVG